MTMEQSLDENFRDIQKLLNQLHCEMRQGAALTEQEVNEDDDFKEAVLFEDTVGDIITQMVRLLEELIPMCAEIRENLRRTVRSGTNTTRIHERQSSRPRKCFTRPQWNGPSWNSKPCSKAKPPKERLNLSHVSIT